MNNSVEPTGSPLYKALRPVLTPTRLAPYLTAARGNEKHAIQLYQWNIELSGAVYEALHVFEVVLRNAIDKQLCHWNTTQTDPHTGQSLSQNWLLDPAPLLQRLIRPDELTKAQARATRAVARHSRTPGHSDILAQMTFGTWRFLLPDRDPGRRYLWKQAISHGFPYLTRPANRLVADVDGVYQLRNRVAHLEPLLRLGAIRTQFTNMRTVIAEIDPAAEQWFISIQRVTTILRSHP